MLFAIVTASIALFSPTRLQATPSYARRYGTECTTCHSPMPPRLNTVGMVFKRSGFRLPDADDAGKLALKTVPATGIGDAISMVATVVGSREPEAEPGTSKSSIALDEVTLVAGTAVGDHYATQMIYLPYNGEGQSELENIELQGNWGKPESQFIARAGRMQTQLWHKANDGSLSLAGPLIFGEESFVPAGTFPGFGLGIAQVGVEAGYMRTQLKSGKMSSTLLSAAALNGVLADGSTAPRTTTDGMDVLLQAVQLFGSRNTVGAFYYNGRTIIDPAAQLLAPGPFKHHFNRAGIMGNYAPADRIDIAAGGVLGDDHSEQFAGNIKSRGGYGELTAQVQPNWIAVYRHDVIDPNKEIKDDRISADVISSTYHLLENLFLTGEYAQVDQAGVKSHVITARAMFAY